MQRTIVWVVALAAACTLGARLGVHAQVVRQSPHAAPPPEHAAAGSNEPDLEPTGKGWGELKGPARQPGGGARPGGNGKVKGNGINYHNGPLILGTTNVYYIWYGDWSGNSATTILPDFARNIGGSSYYRINTTYYDAKGAHVSNSVALSPAQYNDNYSHGAALSDSAIQSVVAYAITSGGVPKDSNGVYFVLTSADVNATSGFCTSYCGWHTHATIAGTDIKYAFIGNPDRCPSACSAQAVGPNGNAGADGMVSIVAHELEESVTDPDFTGWYDRRGYENADKCAWTFGTVYQTANGASANMKLGSRDYLIQRNWVNASGGSCAQGY